MNLGIKALLLFVAAILFVITIFLEERAFDVLALGLAVTAAAFLVDALGMDRPISSDRATTTTRR